MHCNGNHHRNHEYVTKMITAFTATLHCMDKKGFFVFSNTSVLATHSKYLHEVNVTVFRFFAD